MSFLVGRAVLVFFYKLGGTEARRHYKKREGPKRAKGHYKKLCAPAPLRLIKIC